MCTSTIGPECRIIELKKDLTATLVCDQMVILNQIREEDFAVSLTGPLDYYEVTAEFSEETGWVEGNLVA